ncbi:GNAT family N-acetyltransferase [Terrimonas sp. NA20]|uniref:GNAT family N-acetyltransferase n=1 Tax=Terrimonas ginsenosidimutans TaxID=2908004 RepID=A0ABS9KLX6_9BACT|nr:GNAT family N-acetyltransferase [Terrimonas ginsenosidimutans]MCG2613328.1 GNAT family N-acetyltransferase [Terrimonas ginsenosidimutans]
MNNFITKSADQLADTEIGVILTNWEMKEWMAMDAPTFRHKFRHSEFYLLIDKNECILSLARINNNFSLRIPDKTYNFAEFVGFVSVEKQKGYGSLLLRKITKEAKDRNIQMIGFCEQRLRSFYTKNGMEVLADKARSIYEEQDGEWIESTDDDIVVLNLSEENKDVLNSLRKDFPAYYIPQD